MHNDIFRSDCVTAFYTELLRVTKLRVMSIKDFINFSKAFIRLKSKDSNRNTIWNSSNSFFYTLTHSYMTTSHNSTSGSTTEFNTYKICISKLHSIFFNAKQGNKLYNILLHVFYNLVLN